jgi:hypothetical protein
MTDPMIWDEDESAEGEDDLEARADEGVATTTVDWTVETVLSQMRKQRIDLSPDFQRRDAWTKVAKSRYIESLVQRYPVPQIVLAEESDGKYLVIDGKQRLLSIRQFCADPEERRDEGWLDEKYKLTGLTEARNLNNKSFEDLLEEFPAEAGRFENSTIRAVLLRNWSSQDFLYTVFYRLNSGSLRLSAQELRQALYPGKFMEYIDVTSGNSQGLRWLLNKTKPDRRMVDAELLLRFIAFSLGVEKYGGNLKKFLDRTAEKLSGEWKDGHESPVRDAAEDLEASISAARDIFGEHACRKYSSGRFERSLNRAVFDVQMHYLSDVALRAWQQSNPEETVSAFAELCMTDGEFVDSISSTTKTPKAVLKRFNAWGGALTKASNIPHTLPNSLVGVEDRER